MFSLTKYYDTDILMLFHATGDFHYRGRWQEGVKEVEMVSHYLPRVGTKCRCLLDNGQSTFFASSYSYHNDRIEFSETNEDEKNTVYFTLVKIDANKTRLSLDYYIAKSIAGEFLFKLLDKKKIEERFNKSLHNLDGLLKEINFFGDAELWEKVGPSDEIQR